MKIKLTTCVTGDCDYIGLNQIYESWEQSGYVERVHTPQLPDRRFIAWIGGIGKLALEPSDVRRIGTPYEYVLACQYNSAFKDMDRVLPWNFYVRDWNAFQQARKERPVKRTVKSIFSGTIRDRGPGFARNQWLNCTEVFSYKAARTYNKTNRLYSSLKDYYAFGLGGSQFALCPVGDCPICQRESEAMGMGCVAMYTPGVEWRYAVSPVEGRDFITVRDVGNMNEKMSSMSQSDIRDMSRNAMDYFDQACTPDALWRSVLRTIEEKNIKI